MDRTGLFPLAALGLIAGFLVVMLLMTGGDDGGSGASDTTVVTTVPDASAPSTTTAIPATTTTLSPTTTTTPPPTATPVEVLDGWQDLAPPFGTLFSPAMAWTGTELLVWGGSAERRFDAGSDDSPTNAGYRYDLARSSWIEMADSDLCAMSAVGSAWTEGSRIGAELIVWPAGATRRVDDCRLYGAYDPSTDTWRYLDDDFFQTFFSRLGRQSSVVWTGELLVAPSVGIALDPIDGPLLDIPEVPRNADDGVFSPRVAHWTGEQVLVLGSDELFSWTGGDEWTELASPPIPDRARTSAWSGDELLAVTYEMAAAWWDGDDWRGVDPIPLRFYECAPRGLTGGELLVVEYCGPMAVWDAGREMFVPIPAPALSTRDQPWRGGTAFAADDAVYVVGDGAFRYPIARDENGTMALPATMPIGVHFLDRPGDLELVAAVGPVQEVVDEQYVVERMTFEFATQGAECRVDSGYLELREPPGEQSFGYIIFYRTGEAVYATEYFDEGRLTLRLPSRNGSDTLDVSCTDIESTRLLAQQFWEPEY